jgi:secreted Zn-dependent insulinase-like peptidase
LGCLVYFSLSTTYSTINLNISGLTDKYDVFIEDIFQYLKNIKFQDNIITQKMEYIFNNIKNMLYLSPINYLSIKLGKLTHKLKYDETDLINTLKDINLKNIKQNIKNFLKLNFNKTYIIYGNLNFNKIVKNLDIKDYKKLELIKSINLYPMTLKHPNKKEENNLIKLLYNFGNFNPEILCIFTIISNMIEQYVYNFLRTQNQLGYLVHSGIYYDNNIYYFFIRVVSSKNIKLVQTKILECLKLFKEELKLYSENEINRWKKTTKDLLLEKEKSNNELLGKYYFEIISRKYLFNRNEQIVKFINKIIKNKLINYYDKIINNYFFINLINHL